MPRTLRPTSLTRFPSRRPPPVAWAFLLLAACGAGETFGAPLKGRSVFPSVNSMAMALTHAGDARVFVAQRNGTVTVFPTKRSAAGTTFLKVASVSCLCINDEAGLMGLAFHPDFLAPGTFGHGRFYVYHTLNATGHDGLFEYRVKGDPATSLEADPATRRELLSVTTGGMHHNGGALAFDNGKNLLIGIGDGNRGAQSWAWAQDLSVFHGKVLRLDPSGTEGGRPYRIPADNPDWPGRGRSEIYAMGLRNPYRIHWDAATEGGKGVLVVGDVGQNAWEEVNLVRPGRNYGWGDQEGNVCSRGDCSGFTLPLYRYPSGGAAIIGGVVYRGRAMPQRHGQYFFADYYRKMKVMENPYVTGNPVVTDIGSFNDQPIFSFGADAEGEVYALNWTGIFILEETTPSALESAAPRAAGPLLRSLDFSGPVRFEARDSRGHLRVSGDLPPGASPGSAPRAVRSAARGPRPGILHVRFRDGSGRTAALRLAP